MYAATAEDIYRIYKTKGIDAVEDFLKKEFESKETIKVKETKAPIEVKAVAKRPKLKWLKQKIQLKKSWYLKIFGSNRFEAWMSNTAIMKI